LVLLSVDLYSVDLHGILMGARAKFVEVVALSLHPSEQRAEGPLRLKLTSDGPVDISSLKLNL
jgi:hypothetical protein